jgi:hypothetical protein
MRSSGDGEHGIDGRLWSDISTSLSLCNVPTLRRG